MSSHLMPGKGLFPTNGTGLGHHYGSLQKITFSFRHVASTPASTLQFWVQNWLHSVSVQVLSQA